MLSLPSLSPDMASSEHFWYELWRRLDSRGHPPQTGLDWTTLVIILRQVWTGQWRSSSLDRYGPAVNAPFSGLLDWPGPYTEKPSLLKADLRGATCTTAILALNLQLPNHWFYQTHHFSFLFNSIQVRFLVNGK